MSLSMCSNFADFRRMAKRRLPAPIFHYIDGGADDEYTLRRNTEAYADYELMPRFLVDVSKIDTRTTIFGKPIDWPVFFSPTAMNRLFHHDAEPAVVRAANRLGTMYSLSTLATTSLEDVAKICPGPKLYQLYVLKDRGFTKALVERCREAKYDAIAITVDTPIAGNRERDRIYGMTLPPKFGLRSLSGFFARPAWSLNFVKNPDFRCANVSDMSAAKDMGDISLIEYINRQIDQTLNWDDIAYFADLWKGPLAIKGIQSPADAKMAKQAGASAIMISNHGGRQLGCAPAPVDCIAPMRDAVGGDMELICEGGARRGTDVLKALALGANAVSTGRPYLFGLAAGGEAGAFHAMNMLRKEVERGMALMGAKRISDINSSFIVNRRS